MCVSQSISLSRTPRRIGSLRIVGGFHLYQKRDRNGGLPATLIMVITGCDTPTRNVTFRGADFAKARIPKVAPRLFRRCYDSNSPQLMRSELTISWPGSSVSCGICNSRFHREEIE